MRYSLSGDEAETDGELLIEALAEAFAAPLRKLAEPFAGNQSALVFNAGGTSEGNEERLLFERALVALGLKINADVHLPEPYIAQDLIETLKVAVKDMYAYCNGENHGAEAINVAMGGCYWFLSDYFARSVKLRKSFDELFEEKVSARFAYGYRMFKARENFENAFKNGYQLLKTTEKPVPYFPADPNILMSMSVTPSNLADIGAVAYTYIIKLIRMDKMRAFKERYEWFIPVTEAVKWLSSRNGIPEWAKRLIG